MICEFIGFLILYFFLFDFRSDLNVLIKNVSKEADILRRIAMSKPSVVPAQNPGSSKLLNSPASSSRKKM